MKTVIELNDDGSLKRAGGKATVKEIKQRGLFGEKDE